MPDRSLLGLVALPKPAPVKAELHPDVDASVQRCQDKLPVLGQRHPEAVAVIERNIDDLIPSSFNGVDPEQAEPVVHLVECRGLGHLDGYADPDDEAPPLWWWTDPEWITHELDLVNTLHDLQQLKANRRRDIPTLVPCHRRPA